MRGHQPIIELRSRGKAPVLVFVEDFQIRHIPTLEDIRLGEYPHVTVQGDDPATSDVRWAVGLIVALTTGDDSRAIAWVDRFLHDGAKKVVDYRSHTGELYQWPIPFTTTT